MTEKILNRIRSSISRPDIEFYTVPLVVEMDRSDAYWLIQEAERYDECRKDATDFRNENKRLRDGLNEIASKKQAGEGDMNADMELNEAIYIATEALEPPT